MFRRFISPEGADEYVKHGLKQLEKTEHRIQSMDKKIESVSSASDSAGLKALKKFRSLSR